METKQHLCKYGENVPFLVLNFSNVSLKFKIQKSVVYA